MTSRFYFLMGFFTLLLLFYPGNSPLFQIIANHNDLFNKQVAHNVPKIQPIPQVTSQYGPAITAAGAYIVDLNSFTPVFEKNAQQQFYPASTTKIVTALVAQDLHGDDDIITIKKPHIDGQVMGLQPGERITVENLLYGMLVYSGNDAAYAFADDYGFDKYMDLMNKKAKDIGMRNSHFANPAGLDDTQQLSTPYDLAVAGREALKDKTLKKMVGTKEITISDVDYKIFHRLSNVNTLLGELKGVGGLKTGYTEAAGENLVSFYKRSENEMFIIVVLKSDNRFEDTRSIITWLDQNVRYVQPEVN